MEFKVLRYLDQLRKSVKVLILDFIKWKKKQKTHIISRITIKKIVKTTYNSQAIRENKEFIFKLIKINLHNIQS